MLRTDTTVCIVSFLSPLYPEPGARSAGVLTVAPLRLRGVLGAATWPERFLPPGPLAVPTSDTVRQEQAPRDQLVCGQRDLFRPRFS